MTINYFLTTYPQIKKRNLNLKKKFVLFFKKKKNLFLCGFEKEISFYDLKKKNFF